MGTVESQFSECECVWKDSSGHDQLLKIRIKGGLGISTYRVGNTFLGYRNNLTILNMSLFFERIAKT